MCSFTLPAPRSFHHRDRLRQAFCFPTLGGPEECEVVFTSRHPGRTNRSITDAQLHALRDHGFPERLEQIFRMETLLRAWSDRDLENARRAKGAILGTQNGRKALQARLNGLLDRAISVHPAAITESMRVIYQAARLLDELGL